MEKKSGVRWEVILGVVSWVLFAIVVLASTVITSVNAQGEVTWMWNCANPEGILVEESGRIIPLGEKFEVLSLGEDYLEVYDGLVNADYVCEVVHE